MALVGGISATVTRSTIACCLVYLFTCWLVLICGGAGRRNRRHSPAVNNNLLFIYVVIDLFGVDSWRRRSEESMPPSRGRCRCYWYLTLLIMIIVVIMLDQSCGLDLGIINLIKCNTPPNVDKVGHSATNLNPCTRCHRCPMENRGLVGCWASFAPFIGRSRGTCDKKSGARHTRSRRGICVGLTCPLYHAYRVGRESVSASGPSRECILLSTTLGAINLKCRLSSVHSDRW